MHKSKLAISIAAFTGVVGWFYFDTTKTYRIDGWCLTVDTAKLPEYVRHVTAIGPFPSFDLNIRSDRIVRFNVSKSSASNYASQIEGKSWVDCRRRTYGNRLIELEQPENGGCSRLEYGPYYVPAEPIVGDAAILITCSDDVKAINCRMNAINPNGWEFEIWLPRESLEDWANVAGKILPLFDEALMNCGEDT